MTRARCLDAFAATLPGLGPHLCVVGPLPPPAGGMANQCEQLLHGLGGAGQPVTLVQTNAPYAPRWVGRVPVLRAGCRLLPYLWRLWQAAGRADVMHVLANSGWAWHLFATPALLIARWRGVAVVVHYHGGGADAFLMHAPRYVHTLLARAALRVVPSVFLQRVLARHGLRAQVIPNLVDLSRFAPAPAAQPASAPHLLVTRNLEAVYDIDTAIRTLARVRTAGVQARLTIAGSGPEQPRLMGLVAKLGLTAHVHFTGRVDSANMPALYAPATCLLNPSTVDNVPISVLEAWASGVPVVSTHAGGMADLLVHGVTGCLVPVGDDAAMAQAVLQLWRTPALAQRLREAGLVEVQKYSASAVCPQWHQAYEWALGVRTDAGWDVSTHASRGTERA